MVEPRSRPASLWLRQSESAVRIDDEPKIWHQPSKRKLDLYRECGSQRTEGQSCFSIAFHNLEGKQRLFSESIGATVECERMFINVIRVFLCTCY